jgi:hypothetical protein
LQVPNTASSGGQASGRRCGPRDGSVPGARPSQPRRHCRSRRRHWRDVRVCWPPLRLSSRSAGRPALRRCDVTNDWGVLCDFDPLTVGRSSRGADSQRASSRCPMRSSRHRSFLRACKNSSADATGEWEAPSSPLIEAPASSTTLRSGENENTSTSLRRWEGCEEGVFGAWAGARVPVLGLIGTAVARFRTCQQQQQQQLPPSQSPHPQPQSKQSGLARLDAPSPFCRKPAASVQFSSQTVSSIAAAYGCICTTSLHFTMSTRCVNACLTLRATRP